MSAAACSYHWPEAVMVVAGIVGIVTAYAVWCYTETERRYRDAPPRLTSPLTPRTPYRLVDTLTESELHGLAERIKDEQARRDASE